MSTRHFIFLSNGWLKLLPHFNFHFPKHLHKFIGHLQIFLWKITILLHFLNQPMLFCYIRSVKPLPSKVILVISVNALCHRTFFWFSWKCTVSPVMSSGPPVFCQNPQVSNKHTDIFLSLFTCFIFISTFHTSGTYVRIWSEGRTLIPNTKCI